MTSSKNSEDNAQDSDHSEQNTACQLNENIYDKKKKQQICEVCPTCTKTVRTGVQCEICKHWFHYKCENVTKEEVELKYPEEQEYACINDQKKTTEKKTTEENRREMNRLRKIEDQLHVLEKAFKTSEKSLQEAKRQLTQQNGTITIQNIIIMKLNEQLSQFGTQVKKCLQFE